MTISLKAVAVTVILLMFSIVLVETTLLAVGIAHTNTSHYTTPYKKVYSPKSSTPYYKKG